MKLFACQSCGNVLYFENRTCGRCGHRLAYLPGAATISALEPDREGIWKPLAKPDTPGRFCANAAYDACNWLIPADRPDTYCRACRHNGTVPDVGELGRLQAWREIELAKHRLFYSLLRWELPLKTRAEDPRHGLKFDFLAESPEPGGPKVMTGHDEGLVTLALCEADDAEREKRRQAMGEPYRTLVGHFRHEVGHHYWDVLVRDRGKLAECRAVFGDDSEDYQAALKRHYDEGVPADWQERYVSAYATTHPWEDFAETWAHYLHIVDTLEMASAFGMEVRPSVDTTGDYTARLDFDPYAEPSVHRIVDAWIPFVSAMNSVGRSMGVGDIYPFVLSPPVMTKLSFIHDLVHGRV